MNEDRLVLESRPSFPAGLVSSSVHSEPAFLNLSSDPERMKGHYCSALRQKLNVIVPTARQPLQPVE